MMMIIVMMMKLTANGLMKIVMTYGVDLELLGKSTKRRELNRQEERREKGENNTKVI